MKAAIVTIGDEILIGQIVDTNSGYMAKALDKIGIEITEMLSISDDKNHILDTFASLQNKVDLVLITGGLGPTKDDITKKTFCDYFEDELVINSEVLQHVTQIIEGFYKRPISQMNRDQALVPSKCTILTNANGTAPGMWMQKENTVFISLPGVPYEMKDIVDNVIVPKIVKEYKRPFIIHQTVLTYGQGESMVAERIEDWENNLPEFIKLAYLPSPGRVRLRLSARGTDENLLNNTLAEQIKQLTAIIGDIIVGYDDSDTIEVVLGRLLTKHNKTLATAESCTGGKIAQRITAVPGASAYFKGSIVCYTESVKTDVLQVSKETIAKYSVVSEEVAREMVRNIQKIMNVDYAIAVTGNAGPTKDATNEEVGIVFIALATPESIFVEKFNFGQPREKVIDRTVNKSFELLMKEILKNVQ
ncbi:CinA family nicotinamide mononucleotide deamidase-related protein [Flavobacterium antarcticum]|uniref:CinA family nicotinamide mononucleotide deamidase-related protein n=1 Tax=Flavobacterium antarcticum TaxID=271155 RepID=UPI0003B5AE1D|nr:CinA family nicotinamide mononucleotide deamidase-related protein [Flavobacterium antarcticum]